MLLAWWASRPLSKQTPAPTSVQQNLTDLTYLLFLVCIVCDHVGHITNQEVHELCMQQMRHIMPGTSVKHSHQQQQHRTAMQCKCTTDTAHLASSANAIMHRASTGWQMSSMILWTYPPGCSIILRGVGHTDEAPHKRIGCHHNL